MTAVPSLRVITRRSSGYVPAAWVRRLGQLACPGRLLPRSQRAGFEEGPDAGDGDADRVIAADRDAARLGGAARDGCPGRSGPGVGLPRSRRLPCPRPNPPSLPPPAAAESRNVRDGMSRRPARGSRPAATRRGQQVQRNREKRSDARGRRADRLRHGNGCGRRACAGARPREATGRAMGPVMPSARGVDRAGDHLEPAPAAARPAPRLAVRIRLGRRGHPCRSR